MSDQVTQHYPFHLEIKHVSETFYITVEFLMLSFEYFRKNVRAFLTNSITQEAVLSPMFMERYKQSSQ